MPRTGAEHRRFAPPPATSTTMLASAVPEHRKDHGPLGVAHGVQCGAQLVLLQLGRRLHEDDERFVAAARGSNRPAQLVAFPRQLLRGQHRVDDLARHPTAAGARVAW